MEINPSRQHEHAKDSSRCIVCKSNDIEHGRLRDNIREMACNNCGATWNNIYGVMESTDITITGPRLAYVKGDATKPAFSPCIIAHIVNDQGGWGAGFTESITKTFGTGPREHYKRIHRNQSSQGLRHGYCAIWGGPGHLMPSIHIIHMFAQRGYISTDNPHPLNLQNLDKCLEILFHQAREKELSVHMPRIGIGLGGATWNEVEPLIEKHRGEIPTFVYDL